MKSPQSKFKLLDRGFKDTLALIPGWASDYRVFDSLDLKYNYLLPVEFYPAGFSRPLIKFLKDELLNKISLWGWSLGGFLAQGFAAAYPELIEELILVSIRSQYDAESLEKIKSQLLKNRKAFLYSFYLECFSKNDSSGSSWFKKHLLKDYCCGFELEGLISGLDYLSQARIEPRFLLKFKKLRIFHGEEDKIAPFNEARRIKDNLPLADFINMPGIGHLPFLAEDFKARFYHG